MVYISGKITGTEDYMDRFSKAERKLIEKGFDVVNPAGVNACLPKATTYEQYMKMSFAMLEMCDGIYMLDGWEGSAGAKAELSYARAVGKTIMFET